MNSIHWIRDVNQNRQLEINYSILLPNGQYPLPYLSDDFRWKIQSEKIQREYFNFFDDLINKLFLSNFLSINPIPNL